MLIVKCIYSTVFEILMITKNFEINLVSSLKSPCYEESLVEDSFGRAWASSFLAQPNFFSTQDLKVGGLKVDPNVARL